MYYIKSTTKDGKVSYSQIYNEMWAVNLMAISYLRNDELEKTEIVNRKTRKVLKTYKRG